MMLRFSLAYIRGISSIRRDYLERPSRGRTDSASEIIDHGARALVLHVHHRRVTHRR